MSNRIRPGVLAAAVAVTVGSCGAAHAADLAMVPPPVEEPAVTGSLSIYGFLPWYDGKAGVNGLGPVKFSGDPIDLLDNLKFTFMANGDIRWGKVGLFGDFIYLHERIKDATPGPLFGRAKLDLESLIITTALTYQLYETDTGWLQGMAGARFWSVDTTLSLSAGLVPAASASDTISWVDPVVGVRGHYDLSDRTFLTGTALIGGFGAGSKFMWDVFGGVGYRFTPAFSSTAGFRAMGVDYSHSGDVLDLTLYGPQIAFTWNF